MNPETDGSVQLITEYPKFSYDFPLVHMGLPVLDGIDLLNTIIENLSVAWSKDELLKIDSIDVKVTAYK